MCGTVRAIALTTHLRAKIKALCLFISSRRAHSHHRPYLHIMLIVRMSHRVAIPQGLLAHLNPLRTSEHGRTLTAGSVVTARCVLVQLLTLFEACVAHLICMSSGPQASDANALMPYAKVHFIDVARDDRTRFI